MYTSLPNRIRTDQGSQFGDIFILVARFADVHVERTSIGAHSSLELGERYIDPFRATYRKIMADQPAIEKGLALSLAANAMNDTLSPIGIVPAALVFGKYTKIELPSSVPSLVLMFANAPKLPH